MASPEKHYFTLAQAFDRFGKSIYGATWTGEEIAIERPYEPFVSTWSPENVIQERYKRARLGLLECFWQSSDGGAPPISTVGIGPSGDQCSISHRIWKCETDEYVLSLTDGRVRCHWEDGQPEIRVRVPRPDFDRLLLDRYVRGHSPDNPGSGQSKKYNWSNISREIFDLYLSDEPPSSALHCAKLLIEKIGDNAPVESELRKRVSKMKDHGVID